LMNLMGQFDDSEEEDDNSSNCELWLFELHGFTATLTQESISATNEGKALFTWRNSFLRIGKKYLRPRQY
jgi:hypothetical protein